MEDLKIKNGIELFKKEAKIINKTIKSTEINFNFFCNELNIKKLDFILNFSKHPFTLVKGYVMLTNGFENY